MAARVKYVLQKEGAEWDEPGIEAVLFSAEGDMRNALNNIQSTVNGFGSVTRENLFKVADAPSPTSIKLAINACMKQNFVSAYQACHKLYKKGYPGQDIIGMFWKLLKTHEMKEHIKLAFLKEVGIYQMRSFQQKTDMIQIGGLLGSLCQQAAALNIPA